MATKPQFEIIRDKYGFLKCEGCPRRFLTQIGFENHSHNQQKKDTKTEPDELQQSQTEKHGSSQNKIVPKNLTPHDTQECKKVIRGSGNLQSHINTVHLKLTPFQCQECTKSFGRKTHLQHHINSVHRKLTPTLTLFTESLLHFNVKNAPNHLSKSHSFNITLTLFT